MNKKTAEKILSENRESYNKIAVEFSRTRKKFWEELSFLAEHATPGMRVLDIGCGNGRFLPLLLSRNVEYVGLDNSAGLLGEARRMHPEINFVEGDATALPFSLGSFDIAFSFATIHHIPSKALRKQFVQEAARILKPGSTFIVTAWDIWPYYRNKILAEGIKNVLGILPLDWGDVMLTFGKKKEPRYVHAFTKQEIHSLLTQNGFTVIDIDHVAHKKNPESQENKSRRQAGNLLAVAKRNNSR